MADTGMMAKDAIRDDAATGHGGRSLFDLPQPFVPTIGGDRFPVRRIYCIGRNYAEHAREMGSDPKSEPPFFFQKPSDAVQFILPDTVGDHAYPPLTESYHHELELVVFLRDGGRDISGADALHHVYGAAVGLDMTRRDAQQRMKDGRRPWEIGKGFDHSAPVGPVVPLSSAMSLTSGAIRLSVNGVVKQEGDLADMIWSVAEQIAELSRGSELKAGDVIMTGTPAGVGAVKRGDELVGSIAGLPDLRLRIV